METVVVVVVVWCDG